MKTMEKPLFSVEKLSFSKLWLFFEKNHFVKRYHLQFAKRFLLGKNFFRTRWIFFHFRHHDTFLERIKFYTFLFFGQCDLFFGQFGQKVKLFTCMSFFSVNKTFGGLQAPLSVLWDFFFKKIEKKIVLKKLFFIFQVEKKTEFSSSVSLINFAYIINLVFSRRLFR